jgi:hypothetical protein
MTLPYMDTIVAGEGETSEGAVTQAWGPQTSVNHPGTRETCCTKALTKVSGKHIPVSITQGTGEMTQARGPQTCVNHSGPGRHAAQGH